jgi:hypothetical protein
MMVDRQYGEGFGAKLDVGSTSTATPELAGTRPASSNASSRLVQSTT